MELKEKILKKLNDRRAELLYTICEDERVYHAEILLNAIFEIRSIVKLKRDLEEEDES